MCHEPSHEQTDGEMVSRILSHFDLTFKKIGILVFMNKAGFQFPQLFYMELQQQVIDHDCHYISLLFQITNKVIILIKVIM